MIKTLENNFLKIKVKHHGAELCSLTKKETGTEYIWQADPTFWGRHAPVLFPIVGRLKDDQMQVEGKTYSMKQHGLARNMNFELIKRDKSSLTFELTDSEETLKHYPYPFRLRLGYELVEHSLKVSYAIYNPSDAPIYFSIGGHPAFRCPLHDGEKRSDYQLVFEKVETASTQRLDGGIRNGQTDLILNKEKKLPILDNLFDEDALVFNNLNSEWVRLQKGNTPILTFDFTGFPYLGIWSKNQASPFICIEPWFGVADHRQHYQDFSQKEGILKLEGKEQFSCVYSVEIH